MCRKSVFIISIVVFGIILMPAVNEIRANSDVITKTATIWGTWIFDFDKVEMCDYPSDEADLFWQQVSTTERYIVPWNGAEFANLGIINFDTVVDCSIYKLSTDKIDGSVDHNTIPSGTVLVVKTSLGNYAKMRIDTYGEDLRVTVAYRDDGSPILGPTAKPTPPETSGQRVRYGLFADIDGYETQGWDYILTIQNKSGAIVSGTIEIVFSGYSQTYSFSLNTETGKIVKGQIFSYMIIPANLQPGQEIPGIGHVVEGVSDRTYAGTSRRVVYVSESNLPEYETTGAVYWDQATGVLLEIYGYKPQGLGGHEYHYTLKATETNMWTSNSGGFLGLSTDTLTPVWFLVIIALVAIIVAAVVIFKWQRNRESFSSNSSAHA